MAQGTDDQDIRFFNLFLDRFEQKIYPVCFAPRGYNKNVALQVYGLAMLADPPDDADEDWLVDRPSNLDL